MFVSQNLHHSLVDILLTNGLGWMILNMYSSYYLKINKAYMTNKAYSYIPIFDLW